MLHLWLNAPARHFSPSLKRVLDLIAYCILALFMMNSTFNPTCMDNGSVNVYVCMYPTHGPHYRALRRSRGFTHSAHTNMIEDTLEAHEFHLRQY